MEFENASQRCSWVQVYDDAVKALLVEDSIVWANRSAASASSGSSAAWPALVSVRQCSHLKLNECFHTKLGVKNPPKQYTVHIQYSIYYSLLSVHTDFFKIISPQVTCKKTN